MNFINKDLKELKPSDSEGESGDVRASFKFEPNEKFRDEYGFDQVEIWNFDQTLARFLYSHLKAYLEFAPHDMSYHKFEFQGKTYTEEEMLKEIIEGCKVYIEDSFSFGKESEEAFKKYKKSLQMMGEAFYRLAECYPSLWT